MSQIGKIGVIGAGNMGSGIVQKIAQEGIDVVMIDIKEEFVERGLNTIKTLLQEGVEKLQSFQFPAGAAGRYANLADAEIRIIPCFFWVMNLLPIKSIDYETRTLRTAVPWRIGQGT